MKTKTLPMKGIRTWKILLWLHGFWDGKITHTGCLDSETKVIVSAYVTSQIKNFYGVCVNRCEEAEKKLSKTWCDAEQLLVDYANITSEITKANKKESNQNENNTQIRQNERASKRRYLYEEELKAIIKKIKKLESDIREEYNLVNAQAEATVEFLYSAFACYANGLLMKPIYEYNLPYINYEAYMNKVLDNHKDTWNLMISISGGVTK